MILCRSSTYFKSLCGRGSQFKESKQTEIELYEDDPRAIIAILHYLYGFEYETPGEDAQDLEDAFHLSVFIAAKKYMLPALARQALYLLYLTVIKLLRRQRNPETASEAFRLIKLFAGNVEYDKSFAEWIMNLADAHLPELFQLSEFRMLLETEGWEEIRDLCIKRVKEGHQSKQITQ